MGKNEEPGWFLKFCRWAEGRDDNEDENNGKYRKCPACGGTGQQGGKEWASDMNDFGSPYLNCLECYGLGIDISGFSEDQKKQLRETSWDVATRIEWRDKIRGWLKD